MNDPAPPLPGPRADVGVLLVHGIGDHQEGETLTAFGEPLVDWLREWLRGRGGDHARGEVVVAEARLKASRTEPEAPAYALARVSPPPPGGGDPCPASGEPSPASSWLLCEAWWGGSVQPPASLKLLRWMWTRAPLLIYWHFYLRRVAERRGRDASPLDVAFTLLALLVAGSCQLVIGLAMLLWIVPFGPWRRAVVSAVRRLTLTLGDSYVLLEQDIQRAALVGRVRSSLAWLARRAEQIVVIAHSQGAAIAHEALGHAAAGTVGTFITVGSGLEKLHFLRQTRDTRRGLASSALLCPLLAAGAAALVWGLRSPVERWPIGLAVVLAVGGFAAGIFLMVHLERSTDALRAHMATLAPLGSVNWIDLYASHDVVPMGRGSLLEGGERLQRAELCITRSYLKDHVTYFQDRPGCLWHIWRALEPYARTPLFAGGDQGRLERFARRHATHARLVSMSRLATVAAALISAVAFRGALASFGESVLGSVAGTPVADWLKPLRAVAAGAAWTLERLGMPGAVTSQALAGTLFGAAVLFGAIALWGTGFEALWRLQCGARWRRACRGHDPSDTRMGRLRRLAGSAAFLGLGCLPLVVTLIVVAAPGALSVNGIGRALAAVLACALAALALVYVVLGPWVSRQQWQDRDTPLPVRLLVPVVLVPFSAMFARFAIWLWPHRLAPEAETMIYVVGLMLAALAWQLDCALTQRATLGTIWLSLVLAGAPVGALALSLALPGIRHVAPLVATYAGITALTLAAAFATTQRRTLAREIAEAWRSRRWWI